jgi:hypothetical protein
VNIGAELRRTVNINLLRLEPARVEPLPEMEDRKQEHEESHIADGFREETENKSHSTKEAQCPAHHCAPVVFILEFSQERNASRYLALDLLKILTVLGQSQNLRQKIMFSATRAAPPSLRRLDFNFFSHFRQLCLNSTAAFCAPQEERASFLDLRVTFRRRIVAPRGAASTGFFRPNARFSRSIWFFDQKGIEITAPALYLAAFRDLSSHQIRFRRSPP